MSESEWVDVADLPLVPDESWFGDEPEQEASLPEPEPIRFVTFDQFVSTKEETAEALLGTSSETLLPAGGMLLMYGDGGAGKTTLTIDACAHLAGGASWLGIEVDRAVKITIIENEGPRGKFRQVLDEKAESWDGPPFRANVHVLEEPWTRFTLREQGHRQALADHVADTETDIVVMGPLATLGMVGGGTPDEINAFERLLVLTRSLVERPVAWWVLHHENKQGDVSGAWERVPDTLCHVQAQGNGRTHIVWRKARWSSENHGRSLNLLWDEGRGYSVEEHKERDLWDEMLVAFRKADAWRTVKEAAKLAGMRESEAKSVLAELVRRGEMVYAIGPEGRHGSAHCWRLAEGAPGLWEHPGAPSSETSGEKVLPEPPSLCNKEGSGAGTPSSPAGTAPEARSTSFVEDDPEPVDDDPEPS